jgi:ABC-type nitrate/sulfonate/bicarbonate transport system substrate-binding protein
MTVILVLFLFFIPFLSSCGESTTAPAKLKMRYVNFKVYDPVYVALEKGYFSKRGLEVEILGDTLGGPTAIEAVSTGRAEAGLSSIPALINANAAGLPVLGVSDIQSAINDQPLEEYFVRSDSPIRSIKDLKGKRIAVNLWKSSFHYTLLMALEQNGLGEKDVEFVLIPFERQAAALIGGQVEVIGLMQPYTNFAKTENPTGLRPLFNALEIFGQKQFTLHFVNKTWAKNNHGAALAFVGGIAEAETWIQANQEAARPIIARYTGIEARYIPDYKFQQQGRVVEADLQFWLDYMIKRGDLNNASLKAEDIGTNQYNPYLKNS